MAYRRAESALVVIYSHQGQVLLLQRADYPDFWQSVTGTLEQGESPEACARREVAEETGFQYQHGHLINRHQVNRYAIYPHWRHKYAPGDDYNQEHVFEFVVSSCLNVSLQPREHINYQWVEAKEAASRVFSPSNREAILNLSLLAHI